MAEFDDIKYHICLNLFNKNTGDNDRYTYSNNIVALKPFQIRKREKTLVRRLMKYEN